MDEFHQKVLELHQQTGAAIGICKRALLKHKSIDNVLKYHEHFQPHTNRCHCEFCYDKSYEEKYRRSQDAWEKGIVI